MNTLKIATVGVLAAVFVPLLLALFIVVSISAFLYSLPGGQLMASGLSYFVSREVPPVNIPPSGPVFVAPGPEALDSYRDMIAAAASRFGVDPRLIMAVILVESGGNPLATSPVGAAGLMQLMPTTFTGLGYDRRLIYDPRTNIEAGTRYLSECLAYFGGDVYWAAAAYNAGPSNARLLRDSYGYVPTWFAYGETARYVAAVEEVLGRLCSNSHGLGICGHS